MMGKCIPARAGQNQILKNGRRETGKMKRREGGKTGRREEQKRRESRENGKAGTGNRYIYSLKYQT